MIKFSISKGKMLPANMNKYLRIIIALMVFLFLLSGLPYIPEFLGSSRHIFYVFLFLFLVCLGVPSSRHKIFKFYNDDEFSISSQEFQKWIKLIFGIYLVIYTKLMVFNYFSFEVPSIDFSSFDMMTANITRGKSWFSEACQCNHFGRHSTYILYLVAPFHRLFNHPLFMNILHGVLVWSAAFPILKLAKIFNLNNVQKLFIILIYFNFSGAMRVLKTNFHVESFYIPLLLWLFYYLEKKDWKRMILFSILVLSIKEDAGFYIIGISAAIFLLKKSPRPLPIFLTLLSIATTIISLKYVIPYFRSEAVYSFFNKEEGYQFVHSAGAYGNTIGESVKYALMNPHIVLRDFFTGSWIPYLIPTLFLVFIDPFFVIASLPYTLMHSTIGGHLMRKLVLYYSAPFIPFIFYSYLRVLSFDRLAIIKADFTPKRKKLALSFFLIFTTMVGSGYIRNKNVSGQSLLLPKILDLVKDKKKVLCAQGHIMSHLDYDQTKVLLEDCKTITPDYILMNPIINTDPFSKDQILKKIDHYRNDPLYQHKAVGKFNLFIKNAK